VYFAPLTNSSGQLLWQYGQMANNNTQTYTIVFPIPFPNHFHGVIATMGNGATIANFDPITFISASTTQVTIKITSNVSLGGDGLMWMAWGD
jgi:hypothetical protein